MYRGSKESRWIVALPRRQAEVDVQGVRGTAFSWNLTVQEEKNPITFVELFVDQSIPAVRNVTMYRLLGTDINSLIRNISAVDKTRRSEYTCLRVSSFDSPR